VRENLSGLTILLTRTGGLAAELRALGAAVREVPVTTYEAVAATARAADWDWVVFTSARAVTHCPFPVGDAKRIGCPGPQTADAVRAAGGTVDLLPEEHNAAALADRLIAEGVGTGSRVLFPCADRALDTIPDRLGAAGADVTRLVVYRTVPVPSMRPDATEGVDAVLFLSPSAVHAFVSLGGDLAAAPVVAIGETTAAAVAEHGVAAEVAPTADREGLIGALLAREWK
jgi:uroporphyrinogen-III synthase